MFDLHRIIVVCKQVAVGTRDDIIYIYGWSVITPPQAKPATATQAMPFVTMKLMHKLKGHTATILHIGLSDSSFGGTLSISVY